MAACAVCVSRAFNLHAVVAAHALEVVGGLKRRTAGIILVNSGGMAAHAARRGIRGGRVVVAGLAENLWA